MQFTMSTAPTRRPPHTVPADFALALLHDAAAIGEDPDRILARLRFPFRLDDLCEGRVATLPDAQFVQLYRECITLLANRANRESNLPPMSKDEVDMLCYCVIGCENLEEVILRAARFCAMLGGRAGRLILDRDHENAIFRMQTVRPPDSVGGLLADLTGLSFYHRLFRWLIGETIPIPGFGVVYENRGNDALLLRLFHHPIVYAQVDNHFGLPLHYLGKPVVRSYQRLIELLAVFPFDVMQGADVQHCFSEAVEQLILARLAHGEPIPTTIQFTHVFNISSATFRRRLAEEGVTLGDIKERCRRQLAIELLGPDSRLKIGDVALRLGFSDARAFRRAFRGWTGMPPETYRAHSDGQASATPGIPARRNHPPR